MDLGVVIQVIPETSGKQLGFLGALNVQMVNRILPVRLRCSDIKTVTGTVMSVIDQYPVIRESDGSSLSLEASIMKCVVQPEQVIVRLVVVSDAAKPDSIVV